MKNTVHHEILARVPRRIQNAMTIRHMLGDGLLWALLLTGRHSSQSLWMTLALAGGLAIFCFRAFGLMHESVHSASLSNRRWNNLLGSIYGVFCFLPFQSWRKLHLDHHMWTGNVERDPSMAIILGFKHNGFRVAGYAAWSWIHWVPTLAFMQHVVFWRAVRGRDAVSVACSIAFIAGSAYQLGAGATLCGLLIYLYMVEIINFPHHLEMPQYEGEARFSPADQAQFARTCLYPRWFGHAVLLNFNLHTEHHLFPAHPWYQLDALHDEIKARGLLLNSCHGNEWSRRNRKLPIEEVLLRSFPPEERKKAA